MPKPESLTFFVGYAPGSVDSEDISALLDNLAKLLSSMTDAREEPLHLFMKHMPAALDTAGFVSPGMFQQEQSKPLPITRLGTAPATSTERLLVTTWSEVLQCETLDSSANFFELGGHSLLAARVVSRLRRELALDIPVRSLFDRPVLRDLADYIDALKEENRRKTGHIEVTI